MPSVVEVNGFGYAWPGGTGWTLRQLSLRINAGECCCLTGPTGSGKSTLALALKGMLPPGAREGEIAFSDPATKVGLVLQNPETQLFAATLAEEVAFALENRGVAPERMGKMVSRALKDVGLNRALGTPVATLSMGQKYRALIASVLVMRPDLLILDEPSAQLDGRGLAELHKVLAELLRKGTAILLCEHQPRHFAGLIKRCWTLDAAGRIRRGGAATDDLKSRRSGARTGPVFPGEAVVRAESLTAGESAESPLWSAATFTIGAGQRVLVRGANGSGKSTLLRLLAGMAKPLDGRLRVLGRRPSLRGLQGELGFMFQNPQRQLFEERVIDEVGFMLKRRGGAPEECRNAALAMLERCGIADLAEQSPHRLSYGQKQMVLLASVLAARPRIVLLDDPFAGLDGSCRQRIRDRVLDWSVESGGAVIWTSHHDEEVEQAVDLCLRIRDGRIEVEK